MEEETEKPKHAGGRPTSYDEKYCDEMIAFFDIEPSREVEVVTRFKNGGEKIDYEMRPNSLPTFEMFAHKIGVCVDTLWEWANGKDADDNLIHPEFSETYRRCKQLQKNMLVTNGLEGLYQSNFAIFVATNFTEMRQKNETDLTSGGEKIKTVPIVIDTKGDALNSKN